MMTHQLKILFTELTGHQHELGQCKRSAGSEVRVCNVIDFMVIFDLLSDVYLDIWKGWSKWQ